MLRYLSAAAVSSALLLTVSPTASAYWQKSIKELTGEDIEMAKQVAREELYGEPEGSTGSWANPKSGNSGTVTFTKGLTIDGRECRVNMHNITLKKRSGGVNLAVTICKDTDGRWKYWYK